MRISLPWGLLQCSSDRPLPFSGQSSGRKTCIFAFLKQKPFWRLLSCRLTLEIHTLPVRWIPGLVGWLCNRTAFTPLQRKGILGFRCAPTHAVLFRSHETVFHSVTIPLALHGKKAHGDRLIRRKPWHTHNSSQTYWGNVKAVRVYTPSHRPVHHITEISSWVVRKWLERAFSDGAAYFPEKAYSRNVRSNIYFPMPHSTRVCSGVPRAECVEDQQNQLGAYVSSRVLRWAEWWSIYDVLLQTPAAGDLLHVPGWPTDKCE